jgi:hypothetical protein
MAHSSLQGVGLSRYRRCHSCYIVRRSDIYHLLGLAFDFVPPLEAVSCVEWIILSCVGCMNLRQQQNKKKKEERTQGSRVQL